MPGLRPRFRTSLLAGLCALTATAVSACGASGSNRPPVPHRSTPAPKSIFEAEGLMHSDPTGAFATFRSLGVDVVRMYVPWAAVAPDPMSAHRPAFKPADPAAYPAGNWVRYDASVRAARAAGVAIDLTVGPDAPLWAAGPRAPRHSPYRADWMPSRHAFGAFVRALGRRYSGHYTPAGSSSPLPRVSFWAIWNEPNYGHYLSPETTDSTQVEVAPRLYRGLLDSAWRGLIATGHGPGRDTILIGETAPRGLNGPGHPQAFEGMVPLRFIRALYCLSSDLRPLRGAAATQRGCPPTAAGSKRFASEHPALFQAGGFADHPYPDRFAPTVRTAPPVGAGYADFAAVGDLENTLDRATAAYGVDRRLRIYSTEFGYRTNPPNAELGLPLPEAALYLNESEYLSWKDPRIASFDQYLLTDPPPTAHSAFVTGLESYDGKPKPYVYDAWEMPLYLPVTHFTSGSRLQVWGCARPAPRAAAAGGGPQRVAVQFAAAGSSRFHTVQTATVGSGDCYFDLSVRFPGSGTVRTSWQQGKHALVSRTQAIKAG